MVYTNLFSAHFFPGTASCIFLVIPIRVRFLTLEISCPPEFHTEFVMPTKAGVQTFYNPLKLLDTGISMANED